MAKKSKIQKIAKIVGLIIACCTLLGIAIKSGKYVVDYFASNRTVMKIHRRVDIDIAEDKIDRQQQQIDNFESRVIFQRKTEPMTPAEEEELKKKKERLKELEKKKEQKIL